MNKIVMIALLILQLANCYTKTAQVIEIDSTTNIIALEDDDGNIWEFESEDVEVWQENTNYIMIMDNCNTSDFIYDDEIVCVLDLLN